MAKKRKAQWNHTWNDTKLHFTQRAKELGRCVTEEELDKFFEVLESVLSKVECRNFMFWFDPTELEKVEESISAEEMWEIRSRVVQVVHDKMKKKVGEFIEKLRGVNEKIDELNEELKEYPGVQGMRHLGGHWEESLYAWLPTTMTLVSWEEEFQRAFKEEKRSFSAEGVVGGRRSGKRGRPRKPVSRNNRLIFHTVNQLLDSRSKNKVETVKKACEIVSDAMTYLALDPPKKDIEKRVDPATVSRIYRRVKKEGRIVRLGTIEIKRKEYERNRKDKTPTGRQTNPKEEAEFQRTVTEYRERVLRKLYPLDHVEEK